MMPSRAHFLLKRRIALSKLSFSPTLTVDIFFTSSDFKLLFYYTRKTIDVKRKINRSDKKFAGCSNNGFRSSIALILSIKIVVDTDVYL